MTPVWERTGAPPLRVDIDGRLRALRRAEGALRRVLGLTSFALLGTAAGGVAALFTMGLFS